MYNTRYKILFFIVLTASFSVHTSAQEQSLEGVWALVSAQHQYENDGPIVNLQTVKSFKSFKILKNGHYSILTQNPDKGIFGAHMGTYTVDGNEYSEHFIIHHQADEINKSAHFFFKLENNKWYIYSEKIVEVWQRVDAI